MEDKKNTPEIAKSQCHEQRMTPRMTRQKGGKEEEKKQEEQGQIFYMRK